MTRAALEGRLAREFGLAHAVLFGWARSALAALLEELAAHGGFTVLIPSNVCPVLLTTVWGSGARAVVLAVDGESGLVPDAALARAIAGHPPGLAMATQLYGYRQPHPLSRAAARRHGWFLLENDTQATGAASVAGAAAPFADAVLVSFGYAKTLEAGGGGALITDDAGLAAALGRKAGRYRPLDQAALTAEADEMALRRRLRQGLGGSGLEALGEDLLPFALSRLRYGFAEWLLAPVAAALAALPAEAGRRRRLAAIWERRLAGLPGLVAPPGQPVVPWRVVRRIPAGRRDAVVAALRAAGIDAGTNYPPLTAAFPRLLAGSGHPAADAWGAQVINLWVSPDYDDRRIADAAQRIAAVLDQNSDTEPGP